MRNSPPGARSGGSSSTGDRSERRTERRPRTTGRPAAEPKRKNSSAERAAAAAGRLRVRVVEDETLADQTGVVVQHRAVQKEQALLVDEDLRPVGAFEHLVAEPRL